MSFFKVEKTETAVSRWARARTRAAKVMNVIYLAHLFWAPQSASFLFHQSDLCVRHSQVGKGLSKDEKAQKLALQHWLEAVRFIPSPYHCLFRKGFVQPGVEDRKSSNLSCAVNLSNTKHIDRAADRPPSSVRAQFALLL